MTRESLFQSSCSVVTPTSLSPITCYLMRLLKTAPDNFAKPVLKIGLVAIVALGMAGCNKDENVRVYSVAKESSKPQSMMTAAQSDKPDLPVNSSPISWTTPTDWKELAPTSIRIGNFKVPGKDGKQAQVAITSFPGSVGTELDNWNRWRRELKLPETDEKEIKSEGGKVGDNSAKLYDIAGDDSRTVVAVVQRDGASWFFKLNGDKETVASARNTFLDFLKTIKFTEGGSHRAVATAVDPQDAAANPHAAIGLNPDGSDPHAGHNHEADTSPASEGPQWTTPSNWQEKTPGMMVVKSYSVAGADGKAATVAISSLGGTGGGMLMNVNRWRGQIGLAPITDAELEKATTTLELTGGKATVLDIKNDSTGKRMITVSVPQGEQTWFYKLLGDDAVVGAEKEAFFKMVKTARY